MPYTLADVAKATGRNTTTILRAISQVSGTKDKQGTWLVDPAEVHRVYPPVELRSDGGNEATQTHHPLLPPWMCRFAVLRELRSRCLRTTCAEIETTGASRPSRHQAARADAPRPWQGRALPQEARQAPKVPFRGTSSSTYLSMSSLAQCEGRSRRDRTG